MIRGLLAALLLLAAGCSAPDPPAPPPRPALWVVEDAGGQKAGWLFGTIHALPTGTAWETPSIAEAVGQAGMLVVEVADLDPQRLGAVFARLASDEPVPPLARRVEPSQRSALAALQARSDIPADRLDRLETWAAALTLARLTATEPTGGSVDAELIAQFAGRPVRELEGAVGQLAIFDALPEATQRALLTAVIAERADPAADARALAAAWASGDLAALETATRRGLLADHALYRALSSERNAAWAAKIAPLFVGERRPLVAVGAAHMIGPDGLPALLAARGYRVRRIQ